MKKTCKYLVFIVALLLSMEAMANDTEKSKAEIKEKKAIKAERPSITSFYGGIKFTKINLESQTDLAPYAYKDDADYAEQSELLVGLIVFHVAEIAKSKMPTGIYVWLGNEWQRVSNPLVSQEEELEESIKQ